MNVTILSHYRSGIYWLIEILKRNIPKFKVYPENNFAHLEVTRNPHVDKAIFLVRDPRDCFVSSYSCNVQRAANDKAWKEGRRWEGKTFKETLRWEYREVLNRKKEVLFKLNPVEYWVYYYSKWLEESTPKITIRYEDLHECQELMIRAIRMFYDFDHLKEVEVLDRSRSYSFEYKETDTYTPRTPGNWKKVFDHEDNEYVWKIAGELMEKFGYERV